MSKNQPRKSSRFSGVTEGRRRNMQANVSKNTAPEITVRKILHDLGYRFRVHGKNLPGKPDIVFYGRRKAIEVHGCFWHGHGCPSIGQLPKTRAEYWPDKIMGNKRRDRRNEKELEALGWSLHIVWECEVRTKKNKIGQELKDFLGPTKMFIAKRSQRK
jgi:DNA mismatch endonuclease (patch repair protein)